MARIITADLINRVRKPGELIEELLDRQVALLEQRLGADAQGIGNKLLSIFVQNGNRVQVSDETIVNELATKRGLDRDTVCDLLESLTHAGILRSTPGGNYEIANNFLALRAQQKIEAENRVLRTMKGTIQDRMSRHQLLDEQYLNYITPSISLLDLNKGEEDFIDLSRRAIRKRKRLLNTVLLGLFIMLAAMTVWAFRNYEQASNTLAIVSKQKKETEEARQRAEDEARAKEEQRALAEKLRHSADSLRIIAEASEQEAIRQTAIAELLKEAAFRDKDSINVLRDKALSDLDEMNRLRKEAEASAERNKELRERAQANEDKAIVSQRKTENLNRVITSWNAAARTLQIDDPRLKSLVALEAYNINRDNPDVGNVQHPNIIKALYNAAAAMNPDLRFSEKGRHRGPIREIIFHPNQDICYTTGSDGTVLAWEINGWNLIGVPNIGKVRKLEAVGGAVHNCLAISPDGKHLLVAGGLPFIQVLDARNGKLMDTYMVDFDEQIKAIRFIDNNRFCALGRKQYYYYEGKGNELKKLAKIDAPANYILSTGTKTLAFAIKGGYTFLKYNFTVNSFDGLESQVVPYEIRGTPSEVDFGNVTCVGIKDFDNNRGMVAYGFRNGRIVLIEPDLTIDRFTGPRKVFKPHQAGISDFAFSHKGRYLAVAALDGKVTVWDLQSYTDASYQPMIFDNLSGWALKVAFSADDENLLVGCQDGSLYFWSLEPENYARALCNDLQATASANNEILQKLAEQEKRPMRKEAFDELSEEDYVKYFGEPVIRRRGRYQVCQ